MPASISKGELLRFLIKKGHTSPLTETFKTDTENILFENFGLDKDNESEAIVKKVKERARLFQVAVTPYYKKYCRLEDIFDNATVRKFSLFLFVHVPKFKKKHL